MKSEGFKNFIGTAENPIETENPLWDWFGLSRASFLVLPRVLMHEMPMDWQKQMAKLLLEYEKVFSNQPPIGTTVRITGENGKIIPTPKWLLDYRNPDKSSIAAIKGVEK